MRPRIYIDGHNLALDQGTGVATYARNLSFRLGGLGAEVGVLYGTRASPSRNELIREIAFFDNRVGEASSLLRSARAVRRTLLSPFGEYATGVPITGKVVANTFESRMPHYDHIWNVENGFTLAYNHFRHYRSRLAVRMPRPPQIMHWTYPLAMRVPGVKNIYTLHDLVPLRLPFTTLDHKRRYLRLNRLIVQKADHIITVSEASRTDIINLLGADPDKVTNTYQSVEIPRKFAEKPVNEAQDEIKGSFGLDWKGYFMFFGAIEPKKNVGRMIEAFLSSGSDLPLIIVGKQAWKSEEELKLLFDDHIRYQVQEGSILRTKRKIILLDYAPFRLLISLIRGAKAALFPSLYEGFGLPALEAMKLGTPVMTSNTSSLPEVVGEAAITVDPYDVRAMVEAIRALDTDPELRTWLAHAGPRRAALFGPEQYERRLADVYSRLGVQLEPGSGAATALPQAAE
ncbi:MAG: glycosyltransferase family 1 protein [Roseomonas sp.]|jgi:glycosyltransferase involved in cell wall biosynthesis|nr:glycosyltransferase family 1 protein [Roseomonas sp.]